MFAVTSAKPKPPSEDSLSRVRPGATPGKEVADFARLFRFEPTGLSLLQTYRKGRIPVVFIHGLWAGPSSWSSMLNALESDPALRDRYQFWTFGYSTGDPIPYSASLLRRDLEGARCKFDPERTDSAFDRMVVVGHSMGGLIAKMMAQDSGTRLWRLFSDRPVEELAGDP